MEPVDRSQHWAALARRWSHLGPPLRPGSQDIAHYRELLQLPGKSARVLILGVTPELYHLARGAGTEVQAVDRSSEMINAIWAGPDGSATNADWRELPFAPESFDCVLCDGGLHLLDYPEGQRSVSRHVGKVLKRGGQFIIRLFAWPDSPEKVGALLDDAHGGLISNVHNFKLRLAMALQQSSESGIVLQNVYHAIFQEFGSVDGLQQATGWPLDEVLTLTSYQHSRERYHFTTRQESIEMITKGAGLVLDRCLESDGPLGERCPVLSFRSAGS